MAEISPPFVFKVYAVEYVLNLFHKVIAVILPFETIASPNWRNSLNNSPAKLVVALGRRTSIFGERTLVKTISVR